MQNYQTAAQRFRHLIMVNPALWKLILANVAVWFLLALAQLTGFLINPPGTGGDSRLIAEILKWISVPASLPLLLAKPWTIATYMFVHVEFWHLFFNMLWLYWFGKIYMEFAGGRQIVTLYVIGGLIGAFVFVVAYNLFPVFSSSIGMASAIGASASVLAVTVGTAALVPQYSINLLFLGPVKIKYIAIFVVILDILMIRQGNAGGHFAHLGGALAGLGYIYASKHFNIMNRKTWLNKISSRLKRKKVRKVYQSQRPLTDEEYNRRRVGNQEKMDRILDKISRSGYSSLSTDEKEFLFDSSKKN